MKEREKYWLWKTGPIPELRDLPPNVFRGNENDWNKLSPGYKREIFNQAKKWLDAGLICASVGNRNEGNKQMARFLEAKFHRAMEMLGVKHEGKAWTRDETGSLQANVGLHLLDHHAGYGGYVIRKMANVGGGERYPFGNSRRKAAEFDAFLDGIIEACFAMERK